MEEGAARALVLGYSRDQIITISDEGISGELLERPGIVRIRELVRAGGVGHLVCKDLDRLSRQLVHQLLLTEEIEKAGCKIEFLSFDWQNTPEGRLFLALRGAVAQFEKEKIRERTMSGALRKAKEGKPVTFPGTYGYKWEGGTFAPDPARADIVRLIYQWFTADGKSLYQIAQDLNSLGIPSPKNAAWARVTIRRILANPTYSGRYVQHQWDAAGVKHNRYRAPEEKRHARRRPAEEHMAAEVPAIIEPDVWTRAQERLAHIRRERPGQTIEPYELSGLLVCGVCGRTLHGNRITAKGGKIHRYYVCTGRSPGVPGEPRCILPFIPTAAIETEVWARVTAWVFDPEAFLAELTKAASAPSAELAVATSQGEALAAERARVISLYQRSLISDTEVEQLLADITRRQSAADNIQPIRVATPVKNIDRAGVVTYLEELQELVPTAAAAERSIIIRDLIARIVVSPGHLQIDAHIPPSSIKETLGGQ